MLFSWKSKIIPFRLKQTELEIWVRDCDDSITYCNGTYLELQSKRKTDCNWSQRTHEQWCWDFFLLLLLFHSLWLKVVFQSKHLLSHTFTKSMPVYLCSALSHFNCMQMCSTCDSIHLALEIIQIRLTTLELRWNIFVGASRNEVIRWN